jgi:ABC-2 type transport system ATP-binding protein
MNMVVFESVSKNFRQRAFFSRTVNEETHALRNVSLEVAAGEVLGLLGPNGSGKSTTLKLISTVLLPDAGRVSVAEFNTRLHGERSFFPRLTARENLEFFAALEDVPRHDCRDRVESALMSVLLGDAAEKQVMKFSSGMHQRLAIARALLKRPSVLLLDEPSRSLDVAAASQLWELIRELSARGIAILLATHNFAEASEVCERVAILKKGSVAATSRTRSLSERELREFYLNTAEQSSIGWVPA